MPFDYLQNSLLNVGELIYIALLKDRSFVRKVQMCGLDWIQEILERFKIANMIALKTEKITILRDKT